MLNNCLQMLMSWQQCKIGFQLLEFLFKQNPEFLCTTCLCLKAEDITGCRQNTEMKNTWYKGKGILQDGTYSGHKTVLFQCTSDTLRIRVDKLYVSMSTAKPFIWVWRADPLTQQPWFIHLCCTRMTVSVQIWFFPHMRNDIISRPMLNCKLISLPYPNQSMLFVNLTITKIQRSITQRLLISLFYFVSLIDTLQSSGLKQHNGSLETLSATQLGSWH